jgi:nucleoside-diphosphate-sugar epimerase
MARVLIAGCGYVGAALGALLDRESHAVFGLRRRAGALPWGVRPIEADLVIPSTLRDLPPQLDFVFFMAAPAGRDDALYRTLYVDGLGNLIDALVEQKQRPKRIFFTSSTSVYGQKDGEWVDESSPTEPASFAGRRLLEAEALLQGGPFPATVVRFGGIYGPRRTGLVERLRNGRAVYQEEPPRYTNRIHRDDCAGALHHLLRLPAPEGLYLGVDCEPAAEADVYRWLAGVLGAPPPRPGTPDATADPERGGSRRCRNQRLLDSGYAFRYPTFREGYAAVLAELA